MDFQNRVGVIMKMFTAKEEKNLTYILSKFMNPETALRLEELHGLLFGIAITPEPVMPSEWLPCIFEEESALKDDEELKLCVGHMLEVYNRMIRDSNKEKLAFPFPYEKLSEAEYSLIEGWAYGLFLGLSLRPHIWGMSEEFDGDKDITDDLQEVIDSCGVITAIALPHEREQLFEPMPGFPAKTPEELEEMLYSMLPLAVKNLQIYGEKLRKASPVMNPYAEKIGRNELCPCGSGKKYKKCCGKN